MTFVELCGHLAPLAAIAVFMAPIPTTLTIVRDKAVGNLPLLPYSSMISSTFIWSAYGVLIGEKKIWASNGVGLVLGSFYFSIFTRYAPKASPTLPGTVSQHMQVVGAIVVSTLLLASSAFPSPEKIIGMAGVVLCVAMFASPLAALKVVIKTKSAKAIPLPFSLISTVNCILWVIFGWFEMKDALIYGPNALGLVFCLIQLFLKLLYGDGPAAPTISGSKGSQLPM